jgi:hypothetical protein
LRGVIEPDRLAFVLESAQEHLDEVPDENGGRDKEVDADGNTQHAADRDELPVIFGYGFRVQSDEAVLAVMSRLLKGAPCTFVPLSSSILVSELIDRIREQRPRGICLLGLPPGGLMHVRTLVKRLHAAVPNLKIIVGRWGATLPEKHKQAILNAGATYVSRVPSATRAQAILVAHLTPGQATSGPHWDNLSPSATAASAVTSTE